MENIEKIEKIFNMLGSDSDGEALNALALIKRNLKSQNKNWNDLSRHLFQSHGSFREQTKERWRDMHAEAERQRERDRRQKQREDEQRRREETESYGSGRYEARDPYHGYAEYKKMVMALVQTILEKTTGMNEWERKFIQDIYNKNICMAKSLSSKQESILQRIYAEYIV